MYTIYCTSPDNGLVQGLQYLEEDGFNEHSRNGLVRVSHTPVLTVFELPLRRVSFNPIRNANPFFHLMESIWMLAGRQDVHFVKQFVSRMGQFSDDEVTLNGAYGFRWRKAYGRDQICAVIDILRKDPSSRRAVISMWDFSDLMKQTSKDLPCNTHIYFRVRNGELDMTVCNRSNDIVWGLYGANCVHFSVLQEFIARALGLHVGLYYHFSNNYHYYPENIQFNSSDLKKDWDPPIYCNVPLFENEEEYFTFLNDCVNFCNRPYHDDELRLPFFKNVAYPVYAAWAARKNRDEACILVDRITDPAWRYACGIWLMRNYK